MASFMSELLRIAMAAPTPGRLVPTDAKPLGQSPDSRGRDAVVVSLSWEGITESKNADAPRIEEPRRTDRAVAATPMARSACPADG